MGTLLLLPLVLIVVCVVVGALIIQVATRMVAGFAPRFGICVLTAIIGFVAVIAAKWLLAMVLGEGLGSGLLTLIVGFLVNSAVINALVKMPSGAQMGFGKAALVSVVEYVIEIILGLIVAFVFGAMVITALSAAH